MSDLERLESIKSGILGAIAFTLIYLTWGLIQSFLGFNLDNWLDLLIKGTISLITGALFGITYRYIIQGEDNSHLRDGAVLAFGLVRGLVPLEFNAELISNIIELSLILGENLLYFWITRLLLDFAFNKGWIRLSRF